MPLRICPDTTLMGRLVFTHPQAFLHRTWQQPKVIAGGVQPARRPCRHSQVTQIPKTPFVILVAACACERGTRTRLTRRVGWGMA
ncbi:hypothetical protein PoMZ_12942 [Pyricularia oryzae]|uniref:Uncharacterized protein n=1 Tax=Pyricularia oryzae TaxID=318829 RepID=A0A4P7NTW7_PYROR|nr:hypothetical protein PoMZ_12942 [Pyricularia oryzae]